jgi:hypothetical protein
MVFLLGMPNTLQIALSLHPQTVAGLKQIGLQASFPAIYIVSLDTAMMLVFACFAALIVWRRSDDWMIMFVSQTFLIIPSKQLQHSLQQRQVRQVRQISFPLRLCSNSEYKEHSSSTCVLSYWHL